MAKITKDLAEQLYERYAATLMNPVSFEEMFTADGNLFEVNDVIRWTYDNGVTAPSNQLARLYGSQKKAADPDEPYDVGFHNALEMAMFVCDVGERVPVFMDKPEVEDLQPVVDAAHERALAMATGYGDVQKELAAAILKCEAVLSELASVKTELATVKKDIAKEVVIEEPKVEEVEKPKPAPKKKKDLLSKLTGKK